MRLNLVAVERLLNTCATRSHDTIASTLADPGFSKQQFADLAKARESKIRLLAHLKPSPPIPERRRPLTEAKGRPTLAAKDESEWP
jgi:hypothetical protein